MAKTIDDYKKDYADARARGDAAGMKAANDGANAVRASQGQKAEVASSDIAKVAGGSSGNKGKSSGGGKKYTGMDLDTKEFTYSDGSRESVDSYQKPSGGGSSYKPSGGGSSSYVSGTDIPAGSKTQQYGGGNAALDAALKTWSDQYNAARAAGDWQGMQRANDEANKVRNQYGYAAVFATDDINTVRNQYHGMELGGGTAGGSGGGSWMTGGGTSGGDGGGSIAPPVEDYTDLIEEMNKAAKEKALAELRAAFEKNVAGLDRTAASIAPQYQDARNQAAGASEQARRQFAEYAAATGLNSGAGGQGQLAINNALQGSLNQLNTAEASSMADLELQRSQTETDYNNAIAQAEANGDYQLAQQLYQEKVRVDEAIREQMIQQAQMDFQQQQLAWQQQQTGVANSQWNQQFQTGQEQQGWENKLAIAKMLAQYGDFSGYEALGIDTTQMKSAWEAQSALEAAQAQGRVKTGGTSGGGGGGTGGGSAMNLTTAKAAASAGVFNDEVLSVLRKNGYSDAMLEAIYGYSGQAQGNTAPTGGSAALGEYARSLLNQFGYSYLTQENKVAMVKEAVRNGKISEGEAGALLDYIGY